MRNGAFMSETYMLSGDHWVDIPNGWHVISSGKVLFGDQIIWESIELKGIFGFMPLPANSGHIGEAVSSKRLIIRKIGPEPKQPLM